MTTRPDPNTPETPQKAVDGPQGGLEGASGHREAPRGENAAQAGAESLGMREQVEEALRASWDTGANVHRDDAIRRDADAVLAVVEPAIAELAQAIRLTREYVGEELLPPVEGWSWYDALRRWAPHELPPAHNAGPSIREAAADDRAYWERKDAGEGQ